MGFRSRKCLGTFIHLVLLDYSCWNFSGWIFPVCFSPQAALVVLAPICLEHNELEQREEKGYKTEVPACFCQEMQHLNWVPNSPA